MGTSIIKIGPHQPYEIVVRNGAPEIDQSAETTVLILTKDCPFYPLNNDPGKDCPFRERLLRAIKQFIQQED